MEYRKKNSCLSRTTVLVGYLSGYDGFVYALSFDAVYFYFHVCSSHTYQTFNLNNQEFVSFWTMHIK
jgi:hypothetical protein